MAKFKVKFKIQALELEIEGDRDAVPDITQALQNQFGGLLATPSAIVDSDRTEKNITPAPPPIEVPTKLAKKRSRPSRATNAGETSSSVSAHDFTHDPQKWGNPKQSWSTSQKAFWLLYAVEAQSDLKEMSTPLIVETFNKHFRQAGTIRVGHANRDLGAAKVKSPASVGEDTTKNPPAWFLTDTGKAVARKLVEEATGTTAN